jgi:putative tricarboxylic transport membrane protein
MLLAAGLAVFSALVFLKGLGIPLPLWGSWFGG